jgi:hypothetical protein
MVAATHAPPQTLPRTAARGCDVPQSGAAAATCNAASARQGRAIQQHDGLANTSRLGHAQKLQQSHHAAADAPWPSSAPALLTAAPVIGSNPLGTVPAPAYSCAQGGCHSSGRKHLLLAALAPVRATTSSSCGGCCSACLFGAWGLRLHFSSCNCGALPAASLGTVSLPQQQTTEGVSREARYTAEFTAVPEKGRTRTQTQTRFKPQAYKCRRCRVVMRSLVDTTDRSRSAPTDCLYRDLNQHVPARRRLDAAAALDAALKCSRLSKAPFENGHRTSSLPDVCNGP